MSAAPQPRTSASTQDATLDELQGVPAKELQNWPIDRARYRRVVRYFSGVIAHFVWWEIILRAILGRRFVERSSARRWQRIARRYRILAVELGGVLIKLGQFLSVRVDVLPHVVTDELAGLQDEVPAEDLADIQAVIEAEYGQPMNQIFVWFAPQPEAAASLAQVHRARLLTGDDVVVKVQRPRYRDNRRNRSTGHRDRDALAEALPAHPPARRPGSPVRRIQPYHPQRAGLCGRG